MKSFKTVHYKKDDISLFNSDQCLIANLLNKLLFRVCLKSSSIDYKKTLITPCSMTINTVSGHSRDIFYNRLLLSQNSIKNCGFSHIRSSYDRYKCHEYPLHFKYFF